MWRNTEVASFVEWMRRHYVTVARPDRRAGFHGLDIKFCVIPTLYNLRGSIAAVPAYLDKVDPEAARIARERHGCLTPW